MRENFQTKDGRTVVIEIDESDYTATVQTPTGAKIGAFEFSQVSTGHRQTKYGPDDNYELLLTNAFLDDEGGSYLRQGIGRRILEMVSEESDMEIFAHRHDGIQRDDGSHLTGDAPAFVERMVKDGLIAFIEPE